MAAVTVLRRVGQSVLVVALTYTLVFATLFVLPGDPIANKITSPINPLPETAVQPLLEYYRFDRSPVEQYLTSIGRLLSGDLGFSLTSGRPVADLLGQAIAETAVLALTAFVLAVLLALGIALLAVFAPLRGVRNAARAVPGLFLSTPSFLVGFLLLQVFAFQLGWVSSVRDQGFASVVLPALTLAIGVSGTITQVLIQGLDKASREPFVTVLRAKGVSEPRLVVGHVVKNGSIPALTLVGLTIGELLAGAVVVETVFSRTGVGFITQQAVRDQDTPLILAVVVLVSTVFVLVNLATDLLYPLIDPRISLEPTRASRAIRRRATDAARPPKRTARTA